MRSVVPVLTVVAVILALWYAACMPMNIKGVLSEAERAGAVVSPEGSKARRDLSELSLLAAIGFAITATWAQARPRLRAP